MKTAVAGVMTLTLGVFAGVAQADPLLLSAGTIGVIPQGGVRTLVSLVAQGRGLDITRSSLFDSEAQPLPCERTACPEGTIVSPRVSLHPLGLAAGVVSGIEYTGTPSGNPSQPGLLLAADLLFSGGSVQLPDPATGAFIATVPFTMTGHLLGYSVSSPSAGDRDLVLDTAIRGRGRAELHLAAVTVDGSPSFGNPFVQYTLESEPVPEPSSWMLLSGGVLMLLVRVARTCRVA